MEPVVISVGSMVLSSLISVAVDQTINAKVRSIRDNRGTRKAFTRAVNSASDDFKQRYPELAASFFDVHFIQTHAIHELKLLLAPTGEPNPERLAKAFAQQYRRPINGIREPATEFIRLLEERLVAEPDLRDLISYRRSEQTYRLVKRLGDALLSPQSSQPATPVRLDGSVISTAFGRASRALLNWPQLSAGNWIERPELEKLQTAISRPEAATTILVGPPGGGKSALLARLGNELGAAGWALLAIKADELPASVNSLDGLDRYFADFGAPASVVDCLQALAAEQPAILLIDQVDALSELMDRKTGRLSALLALVHHAQAIKRLRVLLSSREVEYRHDARLATLGAEAVILENPPWEDVNHFLRSAGVDASNWPAESRETLRNVEHLSVFLRYFAQEPSAPVFDTYLSMLETLFQQRIDASGQETANVAYQIAAEMAESEELWIARARFEDSGDGLRRLIAADILRTTPDGKRVGFRHQTLFEFVRARDFARGQTSLADWVLSHQDSVHVVRPVLWKALPYLRDADPANYARETGRLWNDDALRPHLRWILITFLGGLQNPRDEEAHWLFSVFDSQDRANLRRKVLMAMTGSPGWFDRLGGRLPGLMSEAAQISRPTSMLLARALSFDAATVLDLVRKHWVGDPDRTPELENVFWNVTSWDAEWTRVGVDLLAAPTTPPHSAQRLVRRVASIDPVRTAELLAARVGAELEAIQANSPDLPERLPPEAPEGEQLAARWKRDDAPREPYRNLLTGQHWHRVPAAARHAPKHFLDQLWPTVIAATEALAPHHKLAGYRESHALEYYIEKARGGHGDSLLSVLLVAVEAYAESDPSGFCCFAGANESSDLALVHRFLARGFAIAAKEVPEAALAYLLAAPERLAIGDMHDRHGYTRRLISAAGLHVSETEIGRLEQFIVAYRYYDARMGQAPRTDKRKYMRWNRVHRIRLLRSIPENRRSPRVRRLLLEEERALPGVPDWDVGPVEAFWASSPISAEQMLKASDEQIFGFFEKTSNADLHDTGASLVFSQFAKRQPERAIALFDRFDPEKFHSAAGHALRELAAVEAVDPDQLITMIHGLADRGFRSEVFRQQAASALQSLAQRRDGLERETCVMLEGWMMGWNGPSTVEQARHGEDEPSSSVLWGTAGRVPPEGNFPILLALTLGYLCREPLDADNWLGVLGAHADRRENPEVWGALAPYLRYLANADRDRAVPFVGRILDGYPEILASESGSELIAYAHGWLPSDLLDSILDRWCRGDWGWGPQVAGEIIVLRYAQMPEDGWTSGRLSAFKRAQDGENMRIGMGYSIAHLWKEPRFRVALQPLAVEMIEFASMPVVSALFELFRVSEPLPVDDATRRLLEAIADHPHVLDTHCSFLVIRLKGLLYEVAFVEVIARILRALVERQADQIADVSTAWAVDADDLMQCALTLQRFPETREHGVAIFEMLVEVGAYGLDSILRDIDRRIH